jgi:hypothetical protein
MLFSKENLRGLYNWRQKTEISVYDGDPSRRLFNRWNGEQVLFIINRLLASCGNFSVDSGQKIERLIINKLPFDVSSEKTVFNWLQTEMVKD